MVYPGTWLVLATLAIILLLFAMGVYWARSHGQFDDVEAAKYAIPRTIGAIVTLKPDPAGAPPEAAPAWALPLGHEDYAGEIVVANGKMPRWFTRVPYLAILLALAYYLYVRAFDPVNLVFAALFILWMIYTPIAQRRGWVLIPM